MIQEILAQPLWLIIGGGVAALFTAYVLGLLMLRTAILLLGYTMRGAAFVIEGGSALIAGSMRKLVVVLAIAVYLVCGWAFRPVGRAFDSFTRFLSRKVDPDSADQKRAPPPEPDDEYKKSLRVLGVTEPFSRGDFEQQCRKLVKSVSPDNGNGTHWLAQEVNAARTIVRNKHGWR